MDDQFESRAGRLERIRGELWTNAIQRSHLWITSALQSSACQGLAPSSAEPVDVRKLTPVNTSPCLLGNAVRSAHAGVARESSPLASVTREDLR